MHNETHHLQGAAPNAKVFSIKVFEGGYLSDLIEGIEWCICNRMDVINLSLGVSGPSQVLASVLRDAYDRGITCVAAVGNNHTAVSYPAALPTVISVGAIGRINSFPEDSAHALKISQLFDQRGGLFAANFSNFGPEVQFCAPGVAILSTVPTGYASWDGTSMSCPLITGLCALILEAYPNSRTGDPQQPEFIRSLLARSAFNLGMPPQVQGMGVPLAPVALGAAQPYPQRFYSYAAPGSPAAAPGPC